MSEWSITSSKLETKNLDLDEPMEEDSWSAGSSDELWSEELDWSGSGKSALRWTGCDWER